ncbi:exodeoxyribonuclease V subunit beta [Desulfatiglans anilini]|uniref:exodeoxyribonuclease V subunit beta n=1 Tax=Desulfatiglans anilini TaxID=90728 RepID=UPI0003F752C0|nr:exodeoxyribonuclease V subunit beta [Desulfatiglans anilini]
MSAAPLFDLAHSPLDGVNLIEASAGTGKTYAITGLFLRLLLEKGLPVSDILVVTFTEAATAELKDRIRRRLREAEAWLAGEGGDDPFLEALFADAARPEDLRRRLRLAVTGFDEAAIFTIHGFCQRMLYEKAFESGVLFDTELRPDLTTLNREGVEDFWRRHFYAAHPFFVQYLIEEGVEVKTFLELLQKRMVHPGLRILPDAPEVEARFAAALGRAEALRAQLEELWRRAEGDVREILQTGDRLMRNRYNPEKVPGWCAAFGRSLAKGVNGLLRSEELRRFSAETIQTALKKGKTAPDHPFFDLCAEAETARLELRETCEQMLLGFKRRLFDEVPQTIAAFKRELNIQSFDDLLLRVYHALHSSAGPALTTGVRARFKAALIDEFQDTDPIQYGIFDAVFGGGNAVLFLIGDPKQAIYGFRGADVFAYMQAAREAGRRYTLGENWRSEPDLVRAVNTFFEASPEPFLFEEIPFQPVAPAAAKVHEGLRLEAPEGERAPFQLWFMEPPGGGWQWPKGEGREAVQEAVTAGIVRLLQLGREGRAAIGSRSLQEKDIAVLVRRNIEARRLQERLREAGVQSVLYSTGNLFDAPEALEMERILAACLEPENERLLKAALVTRALGVRGDELYARREDEVWWEAVLGRFRTLHEIWRGRGLLTMFRHLLLEGRGLERLAALPDGERRCTNFLHLAEVLHTAAVERRRSMEGTLKWLRDRRDSSTPRLEEHQLRLESDRDAVTLITVHRAKGLEWPVVFCPFMWDGTRSPKEKEPILFHDTGRGGGLTLDLGSDAWKENRLLAEREDLAEGCRLLYVALTRARNRCTFVWGRFKDGDRSAPAYILHNAGLPGEDRKDAKAKADPPPEDGEADSFREALEALTGRAGGAIHLDDHPPAQAGELPPPAGAAPAEAAARRVSRRVERAWALTSFSSLTAMFDEGEGGARDVDSSAEGGPDDIPAEPEEAGPPEGGFAFPRGARAGTCLHAVMEHLDFSPAARDTLGPLVREQLALHGFEPVWEEPVAAMIQRVLEVPLEDGEAPFTLSEVGRAERLNELGFYFPLKPVSPQLLRTVFARHGARMPSSRFPEALGRLTFAPVQGFMRGFIDLVFKRAGRYYLVDWKSNFLGARVEDYGPDRMLREMESSFYILQYHLYAVALNRYLALRLPGYRYEAHFGGVYYVFMRGVDPSRGGRYGVFRDKLSFELIEDLTVNLLAGEP